MLDSAIRPARRAYRVAEPQCREADVDGTPFGRYRLVELLGRGGMGEVWRAFDSAIDRMVALKVLPANFADDPVFQERFRREAKAAAGLDEPHVVPIHDFGEIDGRLYVTMRLIKGRDLQTILADGPLFPRRAVRIIEQIASALHAAHRIGLIHRDIKPSNILVAEDDFAYLIDFGIARATGETGLTSTGAAIGTWAYMSPERLNTGRADARADIYALACVLHEALTGQRPYPGDSLEQQIVGHLTSPPPRPSMLQPGVPQPLDAVIARGMAKQPDRRYASTVELARAARDAITVPIPRPLLSPAPNQPSTKRAQPTAPPAEQPARPTQFSDPSIAATGHADWTHQPPTQLAPSRIQPPLPAPPKMRGVRGLSRRTKIALIVGAVVLVVGAVAEAVGIPAIVGHRSHSAQVVLPFTGLNQVGGVAVDAAGNIYVTDNGNHRVLELAAGSATQDVLPFTLLNQPGWVAVDSAGILYVTDHTNGRVVKLAADSANPEVLPFTGLNRPAGVAVDSAGTVYVAEAGANQVLKLVVGSKRQEVLPFTGLSFPLAVAVDADRNLYVTDSGNSRVVKLPADSTAQEVLPFAGLNRPAGVAVDSAGTVYVVDAHNSRVVKLPAGSAAQAVLPFTGLKFPRGVAVDADGNLYVTDSDNNRVLKLPAQ
jgi:serine/threonine protein kinase, bacterial